MNEDAIILIGRMNNKILCIQFYASEFERMFALASHYKMTMTDTVRMILKKEDFDEKVFQSWVEEVRVEKRTLKLQKLHQVFSLSLPSQDYEKVSMQANNIGICKADCIRAILLKEEKKVLAIDGELSSG